MEPTLEPVPQVSSVDKAPLPESVLAGRRQLHEAAKKLFSDDPNEQMEAYLGYIGSTLQLDNEHAYTVTDYIARGLSGAVFEVRGAEGKTHIMKVSKPFNRNDMHLSPKGFIRVAKDRAEIIHNLVTEVQNLRALQKTFGDDSPAPDLIDAQFVTNPDRNRNSRNADIRVGVAVMEKIEGSNLEHMPTFTQLNAPRYVHIFTKLAEALGKLEQAGIVHGDIGPQNILVEDSVDEPDVRIIDFGGSIHTETYKAHSEARDKALIATEEKPSEKIEFRTNDDSAPRHPVYGLSYGWHLTEGYAPEKEFITHERDIYCLGKILEHYLFGTRFTRLSDFEKSLLAIDTTSTKFELYALAKDMTHANPDERTSIREILNRLEEIRQLL